MFWTREKSYVTFHFVQVSANFSIPRTKWHFHTGCTAIARERLKCQTKKTCTFQKAETRSSNSIHKTLEHE